MQWQYLYGDCNDTATTFFALNYELHEGLVAFKTQGELLRSDNKCKTEEKQY
jgi:hypothetical protein